MSINNNKISGEKPDGNITISLNTSRIAVWLAAITLIILAVMHVLEPEYHPSWRFVSEYSNGTYGWLMKLGFFTMGLSFIAMFFGIRPQIFTKAGKLGLIFLIIAGIGAVSAGIFDMDPVNTSKDQLTIHGHIHALTALISIPLFPIAALLINYALVRRNRKWSAYWRPILLNTHITWISLVVMQIILFSSLAKTNGKFGPCVPIGWPNRLVIICYELWIITFAKRIIEFIGKQNKVS